MAANAVRFTIVAYIFPWGGTRQNFLSLSYINKNTILQNYATKLMASFRTS